MIRVVLADDQAVVRPGLRALLERSEDIRVGAEAADGDEAVTLAFQSGLMSCSCNSDARP